MTNLESIPTPGPDCTPWRNVSKFGYGDYRLFEGGKRAQFAYPDGGVLVISIDA